MKQSSSPQKHFISTSAVIVMMLGLAQPSALLAIGDGEIASGTINPVAVGVTVSDVKINDINTSVQIAGTAMNFTVGKTDGSTPAPGSGEIKPTLTVYSGTGTAIGTQVYNNGLLEVTGGSGGSAGTASANPVLNNTVINDGGVVTMSRNNLATNTTINDGGFMQLNAISTTANEVTVKTGGVLHVGYGNGGGAIAMNVKVEGGLLAAMLYGTGSNSCGRGYLDTVEVTSGGHLWLGTAKAAATAKNLSILDGDMLIWNNAFRDSDINTVTLGENGIIRVLGKSETYVNAAVAASVPAQVAGATITNFTSAGGVILLREEAAFPYTPPASYLKLTNTGTQTDFSHAAAKTLTLKGAVSGAATIYMSADLAAGTGDQVLMNDNSSTYAGRFNIIATSDTAPADDTRWAFVKMSSQTLAASDRLILTGTVWYPGLSGPTSQEMTVGSDDPNHIGLGIGVGEPKAWYEDASANAYAAALADWYSNIQPLQNRMGELRMGATSGAWFNIYGRKLTVDSADDSTAKVRAYDIQIGADRLFRPGNGDTRLFAGLTGSYSTASQNLNDHGDGHSTSWSAGAYVTMLWASDWYVDITAKYQSQRQTTRLATPLGVENYEYTMPGMSASLEIGKGFTTQLLYIQPQAQVAVLKTDSVDYTSGRSMYYMDSATPIVSRLGILLAAPADMAAAKLARPYVRVSIINTSNTKNTINVAPVNHPEAIEKPSHSWSADTNGTGVEGTLGINARFNDTVQLFAEVSTRWGGKVEAPITGGFGLRFNF